MNENNLSDQQLGYENQDCMQFLECILPINRIPPYEKSIQLTFIAYITIPVGFIPSGDDYLTTLNINESQLTVNHIQNSCICINNRTVQAADIVTLEGTLEYNVVLDGFRPVCPVHSEGISVNTAFTDTDSIPVSKVLAVSLRQPNIPIGYCLYVTAETQFMVDGLGNVYYKNYSNRGSKYQGSAGYNSRNAANNQEQNASQGNNQNYQQNNMQFMNYLNNGDINRVIMVPYCVSVQPFRINETPL